MKNRQAKKNQNRIGLSRKRSDWLDSHMNIVSVGTVRDEVKRIVNGLFDQLLIDREKYFRENLHVDIEGQTVTLSMPV